MSRYAIGVDLGGTKVEACLVDENRTVLERKRMPSEPQEGLEHVIQNILKIIEETAGKASYEAVGIGTPGTYLPENDQLYGSPHTLVYEEKGFISELQQKLTVPLIVENDANCLAISEFFESCKGTHSHVMAVILGTGVGSGLILNNRLYRGKNGNAGEFGHSCIDLNGRKCQCGRTGCVEAYLSGPSLKRRFKEMAGSEVGTRQLFTLYKNKEPHAVKLFEDSCLQMGIALGNVVNILDLDAIILGGGVSNIPIWYERVPEILKNVTFGVPRKDIPVIQAKLGDSSGVIGAAFLGLRDMNILEF